jgi:hypothetical protein
MTRSHRIHSPEPDHRRAPRVARRVAWVSLLLTLAGFVAVPVANPIVRLGWAQEPTGKGASGARPLVGARSLPAPRAHAVKADPSRPARLYSATPRGLFVSDDQGRSWAPLAVDGGQDEVFSVSIDPTDSNRVVVGRRDGLRETRDGGRAWTPLAPPTPGPSVPLAIAIARSHSATLYVATAREGVFRSVDGGVRWSAGRGLPEAPGGGRPEEVRTLAVHPTDADAAYAALARDGVYRTTDGGATWQPDNQGLPFPLGRRAYPPRLAFDPDAPSRLFLVFGQPLHSGLVMNRLYERTPSGEWVPLEVELPDNTPILGMTVDRTAGVLQLFAEDGAWEVRLPGPPGSGR